MMNYAYAMSNHSCHCNQSAAATSSALVMALLDTALFAVSILLVCLLRLVIMG